MRVCIPAHARTRSIIRIGTVERADGLFNIWPSTTNHEAFLLTFSMYARIKSRKKKKGKRERERERKGPIIDSTIVPRDNRERVNAIENKNVKCFFFSIRGEIIRMKVLSIRFKGGRDESVTSSLSREVFFLFFFANRALAASVAMSDVKTTLQLPSFDRSLIMRASCVNNTSIGRVVVDSHRVTQAFAPNKSNFSITIHRFNPSP